MQVIVYSVAELKKLLCLLSGTGVTANCLHPGAVYTDLWRQKVPKFPACFQRLLTHAMRFVRSNISSVKILLFSYRNFVVIVLYLHCRTASYFKIPLDCMDTLPHFS